MEKEENQQSKYTPGAALIIHSSSLQYIEDIEPVPDRLMYTILRGTIPTTRLATLMPASERPYEEKHHAMIHYET